MDPRGRPAAQSPTVSSTQYPSPKVRLREARLSDLPAIARIWHSAFFDDEVIGKMMHPHRQQYPEDVYWFLLRGIRERFWDWRHQFVIATVEAKTSTNREEKIVGAADWRRLGQGGTQRELWRIDPRASARLANFEKKYTITGPRAPPRPRSNRLIHFKSGPTINVSIGNLIAPVLHVWHTISLYFFPNRAADPSRSSFLTSAVADSEKYWAGDRAECWDLHVCGVDPNFQSQGVGKALVRWGVEKAEGEGENTCASVLCGEKNRGFYAKGGLTVQARGGEHGIMLFTR